MIPGKNLELPGLGLPGAFQGIFAPPRTLPTIPSSHGPWFVPLLLFHMHFFFPLLSFIFPFYLFLSLFFYFLLSSLCSLYPPLVYNVVLMTFLITGQNTVWKRGRKVGLFSSQFWGVVPHNAVLAVAAGGIWPLSSAVRTKMVTVLLPASRLFSVQSRT